MKYDGIVSRVGEKNEIHLFLLNPEDDKIMNGLVINDKGYEDLTDKEVMVVDVIFNDGTEEAENFDVKEFVYGEKYELSDIFLSIKNYQLFQIGTTLTQIIKNGNIDDVSKHCINSTRKIKIKNEFTE